MPGEVQEATACSLVKMTPSIVVVDVVLTSAGGKVPSIVLVALTVIVITSEVPISPATPAPEVPVLATSTPILTVSLVSRPAGTA